MRASSILLFVLLPYSVPVLVAERYGTARLGTLFGVVMLLHRVGAFVGIWLGGWLAQATGQDEVFWAIDIVLALVAAVLVLPPRIWTRLRARQAGIAMGAARATL